MHHPSRDHFASALDLEPTRRAVFFRRLIFFGSAFLTWILVSWRAFEFLRLNGITILEAAIFILFVILALPIVLSFWTAVLGFAIRCRGGDPLEVSQALGKNDQTRLALPRTAIVLPVYNEDPRRVMAGLKATYQSLERTGRLSSFEFFILSDTTDPDVWVREEVAFVEVRQEVSDPTRVFYRNRRHNVEKKTGNIADFCESWGGRYTYMIVFDADSIMTGESLVNLVTLMELHPDVGIIQAPPLPVNRESLFGRVQQFASHLYSDIYVAGLNFWQGGAGNYWGHNAIIRIEPFIEHCRLPTLPGKPPLGGSILSHDFVEAAFMRRAGWRVYLAGELRGSYEELPSTLLGYASRDRRWCQGNLQHAKLLFTPGLHFVSRVHIWMGIMGYVASPLWLLMLVLTTAEGIRQSLTPHQYFGNGPSLFPAWPVELVAPAITLFVVMMSFLLLPKFLSLALNVFHSETRRVFGGGVKLATSLFLELILSTLLAPNLALFQSRFVVSILLGSVSKWDAQDRGDSGTSWREATHHHWPATLLGVGWAILLAFTVPKLLAWLSPVLLGFMLAIPLSVMTSRAALGLAARRRNLFVVPEEIQPPDVIRYLYQELDRTEGRLWCEPGDALGRVLGNPEVCELHMSMLPALNAAEDPLQRHAREGLILKCQQQGQHALTAKEKRELLLHADAIEALRNSTGQQVLTE